MASLPVSPTINLCRSPTMRFDGPSRVLVKENNVTNNESNDNVSNNRFVVKCNSRIVQNARPKTQLVHAKVHHRRGEKREINTR